MSKPNTMPMTKMPKPSSMPMKPPKGMPMGGKKGK